jgi:hypothetical protein
MDVDRGAVRLELDIEHALRAEDQRRPPARIKVGGLDERQVARELRGVASDVVLDGRAVDFLLALEQELDRDRQLAACREHGLDRRETRHQVALVIGDAAGMEPSVANGRLEWWREPLLERIGRLDVVVVVEQERRRRSAGDLGEGAWRVVGFDDLRRKAPAMHEVGHGLCGLRQRAALGRDARQPAQVGEGVEIPVAVGVDVVLEGGLETRVRRRHEQRV